MALRSSRLALSLCVLGLVGGCAKVTIDKKEGREPARVAPTEQSVSSRVSTTQTSLSSIVNHDLQNGRYQEGEQALKRYLQDHPGDRTAELYLRQLQEDPKQALGAASTPHVVQPGESYSTLAAKYLGDPNLFLVLARYNGSTNPSRIRTGSSLQLPARASGNAVASTPVQPAPSQTVAPPAVAAVVSTPPIGSPRLRAEQLKNQSLALYRSGHRDQAINVFDQALSLNPHLTSSDSAFPTLSHDWIAKLHQQAMVFYLDQHLDQAISLWDRILEVDPTNEPATIYRARAVELKSRLQQY
ncbi:tetratricopeptide repeat protein [Dyella sp. 2HG41-7]|uniref:tetratricopeptide repeat protein n=1 Tax=Dyella sp. 2HG41-7 TaxID=2883239 RepID=UPI001F1F5506|nr:tetratricopeptide repeat protein [Dyella sp. 2HG41-7]